jgi:regulator of replication initiation timing
MRRMFHAGGRFGFNAPNQESDVELENRMLMKQNETLRMELDAIMKRLDEMEAKTKNTP